MKACQIKISYTQKRNSITRILVISRKFDFETLHRAIQLMFALENVELYEFELGNLCIKQVKDKANTRQSTMKMTKLKKGDLFTYNYDVFDSLDFVCEVLDIVDTQLSYPVVVDFTGNNLYENYHSSKRKGVPFDMEWCNHALKCFSTDENDLYELSEKIEDNYRRLVIIKNWQDYVHGNIMEIECPNGRSLYVGGDATHDVHLDFYMNRLKLIQYLRKNINALDTSVIKYHDAITLSIFKLQPSEDRFAYDMTWLSYAATLDRNNVFQMNHRIPVDELALFAHAFTAYVDIITKMAEQKLKIEAHKILIYKLNGTFDINDIKVQNEQIHIELNKINKEYFDSIERNDETLQIDVVSVYNDEAEDEKHLFPTFLILADAEQLEEVTLENGSFKTIASEIMQSLLPLMDTKGCYKCIQVRDENMLDLLKPFCDQLHIDIEIADYLDKIDTYIFHTYLKGNMDDNYNLSEEYLISHLNELGFENQLSDFFESQGSHSPKNEIERFLDMISEAGEDDEPIDYKKLN